jgi:hypothetical protein
MARKGPITQSGLAEVFNERRPHPLPVDLAAITPPSSIENFRPKVCKHGAVRHFDYVFGTTLLRMRLSIKRSKFQQTSVAVLLNVFFSCWGKD